MGLIKLLSNNIALKWKETFNQNVDYLNKLETTLKERDDQLNTRVDNLVLHSGGDSPNEVVDARVNNKGETFPTLHGRLVEHETLTDRILVTGTAEQLSEITGLSKNIIWDRARSLWIDSKGRQFRYVEEK
ncbi:hypothetical protein [Enterococcus faecium]|uniref:hypothetical protein n=1 Tax=Enterococcus faecium TaxID=1352 RepID=UPI002073B0B2|nr:hypothetical protein [Enterococcus faecium]MCM6882634.1 hypothetical protein [Enterococcus faecium]